MAYLSINIQLIHNYCNDRRSEGLYSYHYEFCEWVRPLLMMRNFTISSLREYKIALYPKASKTFGSHFVFTKTLLQFPDSRMHMRTSEDFFKFSLNYINIWST